MRKIASSRALESAWEQNRKLLEINAELLAACQEALWVFEAPPDSVGPIMIKLQGIIARAEKLAKSRQGEISPSEELS